jgi:hypothetical protein
MSATRPQLPEMRRCRSTGLPPRSPKKHQATARPHPPHRGNGPPQSSDRTVSCALRLDSAGLARRTLQGQSPPAAPPPNQPRAHPTLRGNKSRSSPATWRGKPNWNIVFMIVGSIFVNGAVGRSPRVRGFQISATALNLYHVLASESTEISRIPPRAFTGCQSSR